MHGFLMLQVCLKIFMTDQSIAENIAFGKEKNKIKLAEVKKAQKKLKLVNL